METLKVIGENVRKLRQLSDIKQEDLALKLGKSIKWLSQLENGLIDLHLSNLFSIAEILKTQPETLISSAVGHTFNNYHQQGTYIAHQQNNGFEKQLEIYQAHIQALERQMDRIEKRVDG
jgi:transcriptional regulator with XRE-family HTH domain